MCAFGGFLLYSLLAYEFLTIASLCNRQSWAEVTSSISWRNTFYLAHHFSPSTRILCLLHIHGISSPLTGLSGSPSLAALQELLSRRTCNGTLVQILRAKHSNLTTPLSYAIAAARHVIPGIIRVAVCWLLLCWLRTSLLVHSGNALCPLHNLIKS